MTDDWKKQPERMARKAAMEGPIMHLSLDGLMKLLQEHPEFVRMSSTSDPYGAAATIWRGEKAHTATFTAVEAKEFLEKSEVWRKYPEVMMRHRATFDAAKKAFPEFFPKKPTIQ